MINFLPRREKYVLWYVGPAGSEEIPISLGGDGAIVMGRRDRIQKERFPSLLFPRANTIPTVIALHPSRAWSVLVPFGYLEAAEHETALSKYEEAASHLLERSMREYRSAAAKELGVHELDAVVVGAYVKKFYGSRRVVPAKKQKPDEALRFLCVTFTTREVFDVFARTLDEKGEVFFTDAWRAEAMIIGDALGFPVTYAVLDSEKSYYYSIPGRNRREKENPIVRERFPWRAAMPTSLLADAWGLDATTGEALFEKYCKLLVPSANTQSFFLNTLSPAKKSFFDAVSASRFSGTVFVRCSGSLPLTLPFRRRGLRVNAVPCEEVFQKLGIVVSGSGVPPGQEAVFSSIAPFLEYDRFARTPESLHRFLRRRIHWMFSG